jgi:hypothetical protein
MNENVRGSDWEVHVIDITEHEATVRVAYRGEGSENAALLGIVLQGALRGPYCELAHTLPADFPLRALQGSSPTAEAMITDPCMWSEELPHLYRAQVAAVRAGEVVAEYHGEVGLRPTRPPKNFDHIK